MADILLFSCFLLFCTLLSSAHALPLTTTSISLSELLSNATAPNFTIYKDAQNAASCYTLPYGALGFVNHLLLTYTTICIALARAPLMPWRHIEIPLTRVLLSSIAFVVSFGISVDAAIQCRRVQAFEFIGIEHFFIAATVYGICIFSTEQSWTAQSDQRGNLMLGMVFLFLPGIVVGLVGTTKLIGPYPTTLKWLQIATSIGSVVLLMIVYVASSRNAINTVLITLAIVYFVVLPMYIEWWISIVTNLVPGLPSWNHRVAFWLYFVGNRLPMGTC